MPDFVNFPRLLAALGLMVSLLAAAQAPQPPMNDAERARRDAEKVFSFIKFQTVRIKPPGEPAAKPARAPAPGAERPARAARPAEAIAAASAASAAAATNALAPEPRAAVTALPTTLAAPTAPEVAVAVAAAVVAPLADPMPPTATPAPAMAAATAHPDALAMSASPAEADAEPDDHDPDHDDAALQLQNFVAPVLTPALQATLGAGSRNIKVRFTVEASGKVSSAEAAAGVPRRLAKPATEAILQWQFAPLPQPRTADVEIAFRRD